MSLSESHSEIVLELAEQFLERYRQGERPSLKDYIDRHPELAAEIREVFPAMAMMENVALADESMDARADAMPGGPRAPLEQLGDYRIIREVGHGGMGIVYEAEQVSLGRHVALKVLPQKLLIGDKQKQRFEREAKAAAKLHHTNIVPVFGVGENDGMPYYVMQFIQGLGLDQVLTELQQLRIPGASTGSMPVEGEPHAARRDVSAANMARSLITGDFVESQSGPQGAEPALDRPGVQLSTATQSLGELEGSLRDTHSGKHSDTSAVSASSVVLPGQSASTRRSTKKQTYWQSIANIGVQVADALDYAHHQGVLHRDIKPSNLLLDTRGTVWVTDFGLAKTDDQQNLTHTGDILGTLRYMSPEAFEGKSDPRSDVYSLGLTIYELLALRPAFDERDRHRLIKKVTTETPTRLDRINSAIPRDFVTIVHKAVDRDPGQRYQSADELGGDLQRFIDDEPIKARRLRPRERAWRWCRHNPTIAGLAAALLLLLLSSTVGSLLAARHYDQLATREAQTAQDEREARLEAIANLEEADRQKVRAEANFAKARAAVDDYLTKVSESQLIKVPGLQPLRRELLQSALSFYEGFLKERGSRPELQVELAANQLRIARINGELGNEAEAQKNFERAISGYEAALLTSGNNRELRFALADCWASMAAMYFYSNSKKAGVGFAKAREIQEDLLRLDPASELFRRELAHTYNGLSIIQSDEGNFPLALQSMQRCVELRQELVLMHPESPLLQHALGESLGNVGSQLSRQGFQAESLSLFERALIYSHSAYERMPHLIEYGLDLGFTYANLAGAHQAAGHSQQARSFAQQRVDHLTNLNDANPVAPVVLRSLLDALFDLGIVDVRQQDLAAAAQTLRKIGSLLASLPRAEANDHYLTAAYLMRYAELAKLCAGGLTPEQEKERLRQPDLAIKELGKAIAAGFLDIEKLHKEDRFAPLRARNDYDALVTQLEAKLAARALLARNGSARESKGVNKKTVPGSGQFIPLRVQLETDLAMTHYSIALAQIDREQMADAEISLNQAQPTFEKLDKSDTTRTRYGPELGSIYVARGMIDWRAGRFAEGKRHWDKGIDYLEKARQNDPKNSLVTARLCDSLTKIGTMWALTGCWEEAADFWQRSLDLTPGDHWKSCQVALLRSLAKDPARFRIICAQLLAQGAITHSSRVAEQVAKICLLMPADKDQVRSASVVGDRALRIMGKGEAEHFYVLLNGLKEYRNGNFVEAVKLLQSIPIRFPSQADHYWPLHLPRKAVLAMALFRTGQVQEARFLLNEALRQHGELRSFYCILARQEWYIFDGLIGRVLLNEAHETVLGMPLNDALMVKLRTHVYASLGEAEKVAIESRRAYQPKADDVAAVADWGTALASIGLAEDALTAFNQAEKLDPNLVDTLRKRGDFFVDQRRWKEAASDLVRVVQAVPENDRVFLLAPLLVKAGDLEGYHRLCDGMVERFGVTNEAQLAERTAKACLFLPPAASYKEAAFDLADKAAFLDRGDWLSPFLHFLKGLAEYRREHFREAVACCRQALDGPESPAWFLRADCELVLSMAQAQLGDLQGAREALAIGANILKANSPKFERPGDSGNWHDWLMCCFLHAEAKQVLKSKTPK